MNAFPSRAPVRSALPILLCLALSATLAACATTRPPREPGPFLAVDLVEVTAIDPTIRFDIRYATSNNFVGRPVYPPRPHVLLERPAAEALGRVSAALHAKGFGLTVFDAYRPWSVTKLFWDLTPPGKRAFVADPRQGSRHNRGCAVDLTLHDLATGSEVAMPSPYDDFTERAHPDYAGGTAEERAHRELLRAAMEAEGFTVYENEWWHFDYKDWRRYPILDLPIG